MKYTTCLFFLFFFFNALAANTTFTGTVADAITKEPLPFSNIFVQGQHRGTVSNSEGKFILSSENILPTDTILFSYIGYKSLKITAEELRKQTTIYLRPSVVELQEVEVSSKPIAAEQIIELVNNNYAKNHPVYNQKKRLYLHNYQVIPFADNNKITVKESDFVGLDKTTFNTIFNSLPKNFIEYQDAILDLYTLEEEHKLIPIEAVSLEEGSMEKLAQEMEKKLSDFFNDIEETTQNKDTYYKLKTGILGFKAGKEETDSSWSTYREDTINYPIPTDYVKTEIVTLLENYANIESENWEFLTSPKKYQYTKEAMTIFNNELVYVISFMPEKNGLFQGRIYVSATSYALLQVDFEYAKGKQTEKFQLLGIGHSMDYKKGHLIYEKRDSTYALKYIQVQQHEKASINRNFTVNKKEKRFFIDKILHQIKLRANLFFDIRTTTEILFLDRNTLDETTFKNTKEPKSIPFKKEYVNSPEIWKNRTVIAPTKELKNYKKSVQKITKD